MILRTELPMMEVTALRPRFHHSIVLTLLLLLFWSCARDAGDTPNNGEFADEPEAHALYDKMLDTIRNAETMYYESDYRWVHMGQEIGRAVYRIWMKKPNYVRIEAHSPDGTEKGVLIGDGEYFWTYWPKGRPHFAGTESEAHERTRLNSFMKKPAPHGRHSIAHDIEALTGGLTMTVLEPSIFHGYVDAFDKYLDGV